MTWYCGLGDDRLPSAPSVSGQVHSMWDVSSVAPWFPRESASQGRSEAWFLPVRYLFGYLGSQAHNFLD